MHPVDLLILFLIVVSLVECAIEARRKRWWASGIALVFAVLLIWIGKGIFVSLWQRITGP